jgi:hypothetical protein
MKKTLLHLFQNKFTDHDYNNREYGELEKKFKTKVIVHDLSKIFHSDLSHVKVKRFKKTIKFDSLYKWIKTLDKLKKKKNVTVINELGYDSFKSLIIFYFLKKSNIPMIIDRNIGVVDEAEFFTENLNLEKIWIKIKKVFRNYTLLTFFLKKKFLNVLYLFIKYKKITVLWAGRYNRIVMNLPFKTKQIKIVKVHSRDYSQFLYRKKINNTKKKPIIFLDAPLPYFKSDEDLIFNDNQDIDIAKWYREHNIFFDKLENFFSTKVVIVPHPKVKGFQNPYFKKRLIDNRLDAALQLTSQSLFVITGVFVSTAISFAIAETKPILFIRSDQMKSHYAKQIIYEKEAAKLIGTNVIDINNFKKKDILKIMKVNKKCYNNYKYRFLTSKQLIKKPNHMILGNLI